MTVSAMPWEKPPLLIGDLIVNTAGNTGIEKIIDADHLIPQEDGSIAVQHMAKMTVRDIETGLVREVYNCHFDLLPLTPLVVSQLRFKGIIL